ncbi:MAG: hypothetical protein ACOYN2_04455 [Patescibacteria group bacterium]
MKSLRLILSSLFILTLTASFAYAAVKIAPLSNSKVITYLTKILANPTDATDGTVKKAVALSQSCKAGEVIQGFGANNEIICVPQVKNNSTVVPPALVTPTPTPTPAATAKSEYQKGYGCYSLHSETQNSDTYIMFCNNSKGKICIYKAVNGYGKWNCDTPKGYGITDSEDAYCSASIRETLNMTQTIYNAHCTSMKGKLCTYSGFTDSDGKFTFGEWKCTDVKESEKMAEFR